MPGRGTAPRKGKNLQNKVVALIQKLGLEARTEVTAARRLWGAKRRIDVIAIDEKSGKSLGIECKFQGGAGTAEEKIPATISDIASWPLSGIVVIDGEGYTDNMVSFLISTGKVVKFEDLEDWLRLFFGIHGGKSSE